MNAPFFTFQDFEIPDYMGDGIKLWIEHGVPPGSFLSAVIANDLREAVACADRTNLRNLPAYVAFFYNHAPRGCWGSRKALETWKGATPPEAAL